MPQIVYVLTNEAMPGLIKIGMTADSVGARVSQLSAHSGVPLPFECYFAAEVPDHVKLEKILHQLFGDARLNPKREFFKLDPEKAVLAISIGDFKEITPGVAEIDKEEQQALDKIKARRSKLNLDAIGIKSGDVLTFSRDESVTGVVVEGGKLLFDGDVMSLSAAALKSLHAMGYKTPAASGPGYWMFEGELLEERRRRLEVEQYGTADDAI